MSLLRTCQVIPQPLGPSVEAAGSGSAGSSPGHGGSWFCSVGPASTLAAHLQSTAPHLNASDSRARLSRPTPTGRIRDIIGPSTTSTSADSTRFHVPPISRRCAVTAAAISAGVPATFLSNYQAAMAFLDGLETYCASRAALTALRKSPFYASFLRRWKLSIYFSTRFQVGPQSSRRVV